MSVMPAGTSVEAAVPAPAESAGALEVRSLRVRFGGLTALDGVSLEVPAGQIVGIIGPNGAGKTTLFNVVCGLVAPESGDVVYNGRSIKGVRPHELNGLGIARTLQGLGLWRGLTVLENVMVGARRRGRPGFASAMLGMRRSERYEEGLRNAALEQLRELGIAEHANRHPVALPHGVQKWVSLARALVSKPAMLLLDEPASGLTSGEIKQLISILRARRERMSIALVEHRLDLVMNVCDHVYVLDFGRMIAAGRPEDVQGDKAVTDAYLGEELVPTHDEVRPDARD